MVKACQVLGLNRSTVAARRKRADNDEPPRRSRLHAVQPRALSQQERAVVTALLHSEAHCDQAPAAVYQRLLEQSQYHCSVSTMHRILRSNQEAGSRKQVNVVINGLRSIMPSQGYWPPHRTMSGPGTVCRRGKCEAIRDDG